MEPRIKGHRLHVGGQYACHEREARQGHRTRMPGAAICECGAYSPALPSVIDRANWHRQHIADVISGKARLL